MMNYEMFEHAYDCIDWIYDIVEHSPDITILSHFLNINFDKMLENSNVISDTFADAPEGIYFMLVPRYHWRIFVRD